MITHETRREAYEMNAEKRQTIRERILELMSDGNRWSVSKLCGTLNMKYTSVRPRVCDLNKEGMIRSVDITNDYGIREAVYVEVQEC